MKPLDALMTLLFGPIEPPARDPLHAVAGTVLRQMPHLRGPHGRLRAMRIVYMAHSIHLGRTGSGLFDDRVEATTYGPVVPRLLEDLRRHVPRCLDAHHRGGFANDESQSIADACQHAAGMTDGQLVATLHRNDGAWAKSYRTGHRTERGPAMPIAHIADDLVARAA